MININHVSKAFTVGSTKVEALKDVSITIEDGDIYGIIGMSGAGKSTLVRCINMLERPTSGSIVIDGCDMGALSEKKLRALRRNITMIFQNFNLLMQRTCLKNICFPLELSGVKPSEAKKRAQSLLEMVGLPEKANAYPSQLSGGQQQRIAIARALATDPKVLLCDEATSALDPQTTHSILSLIKDINRTLGITVVVITHQMSVVEDICHHVAILDDGRVVEKGLVSDIFSNPRSTAARRLVFPDSSGAPALASENEECLRVIFNGACAASSPLITQMAIDTGIAANILAASTKSIDGKVYGSIFLGLPKNPEIIASVKAYLGNTSNIFVEEVAN